MRTVEASLVLAWALAACGRGAAAPAEISIDPAGRDASAGPVILAPGPPSQAPRARADEGPVRVGELVVNGRLDPEAIGRVVRSRVPSFGKCYDAAYKPGAMLEGRVTVKFVIHRDGNVAVAADGGSDLPEPSVVQCVIEQVRSLRFPQPEAGVVTVVAPLFFTPRD